MAHDSFLTRHLREAGEGYFEHMGFTMRAAGTLIAGGLAIFIHGLMPFLCTTTGSDIICKMYDEMKARKAECEKRRLQAGS